MMDTWEVVSEEPSAVRWKIRMSLLSDGWMERATSTASSYVDGD